MATILPIQSIQQQSQQASQPQNASSDPLFDALVKYITASPGAQSTTATQLQDIIDSHSNVEGGRAYLESLVSPDPIATPKVWRHSSEAHGFASTNMDHLTLVFTAMEAYLSVRGTAKGFFGPQVSQFNRAVFFWDDLTTDKAMKVSFEIVSQPQWRQTIVYFYPEVYIPENKQPIAELIAYESTLRLPPQGANGFATFKPIFRPQ